MPTFSCSRRRPPRLIRSVIFTLLGLGLGCGGTPPPASAPPSRPASAPPALVAPDPRHSPAPAASPQAAEASSGTPTADPGDTRTAAPPTETEAPPPAELARSEDEQVADTADPPAEPPGPPEPDARPLSRKEIDRIKRMMIQASIDAYDGPCPCPYNTMRNGRRCGRRSAYDRPGGEAPLCFPGDISEEMVREFIAAQPRQDP